LTGIQRVLLDLPHHSDDFEVVAAVEFDHLVAGAGDRPVLLGDTALTEGDPEHLADPVGPGELGQRVAFPSTFVAFQ
jgi:hypothetical protein